MKETRGKEFVAEAHYDDIFEGFVSYLWWLGYSISDREGNEMHSLFKLALIDRFGILCKDPYPKIWKLFWLIPIRLPTKRLLLGFIYAGRGACSGQRYFCLIVDGERYLKFAEELAIKINQTFNVDIHCRVVSKEAVREKKWKFFND